MTNTFWVAANILFDLETGKKTEVLLLVNREGDASYFTRGEAETFKGFVERRATNINWYIDPTNQRTGRFVVRGVQHVE
jgi:hypothetical protein